MIALPKISGYTVIRELHRGGMTDLFVARSASGRRVVIRILKQGYARDRRIHKQFLKAAEILRHIQHPNIIHLLDVGSVDGVPMMIIEYLESRNLRNLIINADPILHAHRLVIIRQAASALGHLHSCGYLHMDFKPENLLYTSDGRTVLTDFDLVMLKPDHPIRISALPATPSYVAPEVREKHRVDERADIYSFGVTTFELIALRKPWEVNGPQVAGGHQRVAPPTPSLLTVEPAISKELDLIIGKCLAKNPDDRYPSMSLVIRDLESLK